MTRKNHNSRTAKKILGQSYKSISRYANKHTVIFAFLLYVAYFLVLQNKFLFSTDVWAETHAEYLYEATKHGFLAIFSYGWAGYITLIPSLAAKLYLKSPLPFGYADVFFQLIIVSGAIGVSSFIASKFNITLFRSYAYRLVLGLTLLMLLQEKSTFTIINIGYAAFLPIVFVSLNHTKLKNYNQILYSIFGVVVALTKPSLVLVPFVLYRIVKTKEYISGTAILIAIFIQSYVMLFIDPRHSASKITHDLSLVLGGLVVGSGTEFLKLIHISPSNLAYIIVADLVLLTVMFLAIMRIGLIRGLLLAFGFLYSVYTYILAPDATVYSGISRYKDLYAYNYKIQREYLIFAFLVIAIFFAVPILYRITRSVLSKISSAKVAHKVSAGFAITLISILIFTIYTPINVESSGVAANIDAYREGISKGESSCVPIPPTPGYFETNTSIWRFEYNTVCYTYNADLSPDYKNFNIELVNGRKVVFKNLSKSPLQTFYLVIKNEKSTSSAKLAIIDTESGKEFYANIPSKSREKFSYIPIKTSGLAYKENYELILKSNSSSIYWGRFKENGEPAFYPMYGDRNPPTPYR